MASRNFNYEDENRFRIFVGNLPKNMIASHFDSIFPNCNIQSVNMVRDHENDSFRGHAYVELKDEESYFKALEADGLLVNDMKIRVNDADKRGRGGYTSRSGRGGYNRGGRESEGRRQSSYGSGSRGGYGRGNYENKRGNIGYDRPSYRSRYSSNAPISEPIVSIDSEDRPKVVLQPRSKPIESFHDRALSERAKAIFGSGKPREASPVKNVDDGTNKSIGKT